jgi:hypothetical protein
MPTQTQYEYLRNNIDKVKEPIAIIGSKLYDYDKYDFTALVKESGFTDITGMDLSAGTNVDIVIDITDTENPFFNEKQSYYNTVICMSVLMYVNNPFNAGNSLSKIASKGATLFLSEPFIHKSTSMPVDNWRFTFNSLNNVFKDFEFNEDLQQCSFTRSNIVFKNLRDDATELLYGKRHADENIIAYLLRRISLKLFSRGIFKVSRLMPEISLFTIGKKK